MIAPYYGLSLFSTLLWQWSLKGTDLLKKGFLAMVFIAFSTWRRKGRQFSGTIPSKIRSLSTFSSFFRDLLISVCRRRFHPYLRKLYMYNTSPPPLFIFQAILNAAIQKRVALPMQKVLRFHSRFGSNSSAILLSSWIIQCLGNSNSCVSVCTWFLLHHFYLFEWESQQIFGHPEWLQITTGTQ